MYIILAGKRIKMGKKHNPSRNLLLGVISMFLLLQLAVHDYQDIIHTESLSPIPAFENVHPVNMASSGLEKWQILAT